MARDSELNPMTRAVAGAATSAYERGMSVHDISVTVTAHHSEEQARRYVHKVASESIQLRIGRAD